MHSDYVIIGLSFFEGIALIISPCILPILPIILAGSIAGSVRRPLGIITGFILTFTIFTFFSRQLVLYAGLDLNTIRHLSYAILLLLGVIMMSSTLTDKFTLLTLRLSNVGSSLEAANNPQSGFLGGLLFGGLISIIWTPCAGPILAAVIVQTLLQQSTLINFIAMLCFSIGVAVPMFLIALFGRNLLSRFSIVQSHTAFLRKLTGLIIIICVAYIINLEYRFISASPRKIDVTNSTALINGVVQPYAAGSLEGADAWINSPPLSLQALKGKVVLIDFWTYSCINCIRTLPYIKGWYDKFHDKGLVIIGVHAPEFEFEKDFANVDRAVKKDGIKYPVALDNQYRIWRAYDNHYWPAHYLIDKNGDVVYTHFGEGEYEVTENNIRYLLGIRQVEATKQEPAQDVNLYTLTPETYFGYARADHFASPESVVRDAPANYTLPATLSQDAWALQGSWTVYQDKIKANAAGNKLVIHFNARHVYLVAGSSSQSPVQVTVQLNGKDVARKLTIDKHTLYDVIDTRAQQTGTLTLTTAAGGVEFYTFTFG